MPNKNDTKGIIYVAFGYDYFLMAAHSASTAKKTNPGIICSVVTNVKFDNTRVQPYSPFDHVTIVERESKYNREIKTNIIHYTNLERCLYLDCDTEVWGSLEPIFSCLDNFDVAIKLYITPMQKEYEIAPGIPGNLFSVWNGGAVFFRNNGRAKKLFDQWTKIFMEEEKNRDEPSLARAIYTTPEVRLLSLSAIWNTSPNDIKLLKNGLKNTRIWHYRHPHLWPDVAPALYRMHQSFRNTIIDPTEIETIEIDNAARRYKFLSSPIYRHSINSPILGILRPFIVNQFMKVGKRLNIKITRDRQRHGKGYARITSK